MSSRIHGAYDQVNRLCAEIAGKYGWGFVNVNLRPYYAEGSKSMGFEICEQLGWRIPEHTVVPMASGSLLTKIHKAYRSSSSSGWWRNRTSTSMARRRRGCSPISTPCKKRHGLLQAGQAGHDCRIAAIGTPADGFLRDHAMKETGGSAEDVTDDEILEGIRLLAECEGIFAETAGGVTVALRPETDRQRANSGE